MVLSCSYRDKQGMCISKFVDFFADITYTIIRKGGNYEQY